MKPRSDLFVKVKVSVDTSSHVAPIAVVQKKSPEESKESHIDTYLNSLGHKITTLGTYSYCESSNQLWVKCYVAIKGIKNHPKDKIEVRFTE